MRKAIAALLAMIVMGCSSAPKVGIENAGHEEVISRMDDLSSRPSWVKESTPFQIEGGKVLVLGMTTTPADNVNLAAVYRISENNGKATIVGAIESRLEFVFQNAEEGVELGSSQARYIGAEASKLTTSSIRSTKRYWEKVRQVQENGQPVIRIRAFSLLEMPEPDFKSAIVDAVRRSHGKQGISPEFAAKVDRHWDQFVAGEDRQEARKPASVEGDR